MTTSPSSSINNELPTGQLSNTTTPQSSPSTGKISQKILKKSTSNDNINEPNNDETIMDLPLINMKKTRHKQSASVLGPELSELGIPSINGYLKTSRWKRKRFFVAKNAHLIIFKRKKGSSSKRTPLASIDLRLATTICLIIRHGRQSRKFAIQCTLVDHSKSLYQEEAVFLVARTRTEAKEWVDVLNRRRRYWLQRSGMEDGYDNNNSAAGGGGGDDDINTNDDDINTKIKQDISDDEGYITDSEEDDDGNFIINQDMLTPATTPELLFVDTKRAINIEMNTDDKDNNDEDNNDSGFDTAIDANDYSDEDADIDNESDSEQDEDDSFDDELLRDDAGTDSDTAAPPYSFARGNSGGLSSDNLQQQTTTINSSGGSGRFTMHASLLPQGSKLAKMPPITTKITFRNEPTRDLRIRGNNYLTDRIKIPAKKAMFRLIASDVFIVPKRTDHIVSHPENRVAQAISRGEPFPEMLYIVNLQIPGPPFYSVVLYFAPRDKEIVGLLKQMKIAHQNKTKASSYGQFNQGLVELLQSYLFDESLESDHLRDQRFKLIPRVIEGPWVVKKAVGSKPALIGTKLKQRYFFSANSLQYTYQEVDVDIGSSIVAWKCTMTAAGYARLLVCSLSFVVEGRTEEELPEEVIAAMRCTHLNFNAHTGLGWKEDGSSSPTIEMNIQ